jgi:hypothetical protein
VALWYRFCAGWKDQFLPAKLGESMRDRQQEAQRHAEIDEQEQRFSKARQRLIDLVRLPDLQKVFDDEKCLEASLYAGTDAHAIDPAAAERRSLAECGSAATTDAPSRYTPDKSSR